MKVLLTGITGNLGYEIAQSLHKHDAEVVSIIRNASAYTPHTMPTESVIECDLVKIDTEVRAAGVDCIVHSAGSVHFKNAGDTNSQMMRSVIKIAQKHGVPIYYISTAFLWRPHGSDEVLRNAYEKDKYHAEQLLRDSDVRHTIFRPSVLVGHSSTGLLRNWSGYYVLVRAFLKAASQAGGERIRFPLLTGTSNMVPVDQAADIIAEKVVTRQQDEIIYITNPEPPSAQWVLDTTLKFFNIAEQFARIPTHVSDDTNDHKTQAEEVLCTLGQHFNPYWSLAYNFPNPACPKNLITEAYLEKTLSVFQEHTNRNAV